MGGVNLSYRRFKRVSRAGRGVKIGAESGFFYYYVRFRPFLCTT